MAHLTRRRFLAGAGAATAAAAFSGYATAYEAANALALTAYAPRLAAWPESLELTIAVIADIHACYPWMSEERVGEIVDLANAQRPDLTVLLGDFVCTHAFVTGYVPPGAWAEQLARLEAPLGVYSILGNHDWWSAAIPTDPPDNSLSVRRALEAVDIPVLENQSLRLAQRSRPFWLIGLGDQLARAHRPVSTRRQQNSHGAYRGVDDLAGAMRPIDDDAPAILLAHEPYVYPVVPDRVALTLSGHMHGGQVNLPLVGSPVSYLHRRTGRFIYGEYAMSSRLMIVSGGLGTSFAPVRVLRPPEVVLVKLGGDPSGSA
jgi:predicted MPP superfamily phosphohydrolase